MLKISPPSFLISVCTAGLLLTACTPKYDWREVRGSGAPFVVTLPAKPTSVSRPIDLDGLQVTMTMTAAEIDGVTFAVGSVVLPDTAQAQAALNAMKTALVKNIGGTILHEKSSATAQATGDSTTQTTSIEIEASGTPSANSGGQPRLLFARFVAKQQRVYQAIVVGKEKAVSREAVDTFLTSFKPD